MLGTLSTSVSLDVIWNENSGISLQPKILHINVADTMAYTNSADQDQTAPEGGAVQSGSMLFAIIFSILRNNRVKSKI